MIKWDNIKIYHAALSGGIYLGRINKDGFSVSDKSKDKTDEAIRAIASHMMGRKDCTPDIEYVSYDFPGYGSLRWYPAKKEENKDDTNTESSDNTDNR